MIGTTVKFVASDSDGLPVKRKQVQQACEACRRRKKRCTHAHGKNGSSLQSAGSSPGFLRPTRNTRLPPSPQSPVQPAVPLSGEDPSAEAASGLVELSSSRFVGDLNPESIFIEATRRSQDEPHSLYRDRSDIGTWLPPAGGGAESITSATNLERMTGGGNSSMASPLCYSAVTLSSHHSWRSEEAARFDRSRHTYIFQECLALTPPEEDFEFLKTIFLERVHPIFPVFNSLDITGKHPSKVARVVIKQVVSLVAGTDPRAFDHLRLEQDGPVLPFQEFHQRLAHAIFSILDANMLISRIDHIRVLAMMSFFYQPASAADRDLPSLLCSQAIHYAQSLGIQLRGYRPQRQDENIEQLFCAIWALDRMTATFYGRPCIYHERDIDRDMDECIDQQPPCFRLFLRVVQYLDRVIDLYRPRKSEFVAFEFPVFEGMVLDAGAEKASSAILGTIETLYHTVAVLSCRQSPALFQPSAPERAHLPHHSINPRRSLSADRIVMVVQSEEICPLPFIPYAVSLSLSVAYRKMRHSRVPMYRVRARAVFKEIVDLLKQLGEVYSIARINAGLGESILREMEKTANSLTTSGDVGTPSRRLTDNSIPEQPRGQAVGTASIEEMRMEPSARTPVPLNMSLDQTGFEGLQNSAGISTPLDPALLDNLDDIDIFGHFDPGFDLGAVDAALEANLDMSCPLNWAVSWSQFTP